jgi:hypothetical protein
VSFPCTHYSSYHKWILDIETRYGNIAWERDSILVVIRSTFPRVFQRSSCHQRLE